MVYPSSLAPSLSGLGGAGGALLGWRHFVRTLAHGESQAELRASGGAGGAGGAGVGKTWTGFFCRKLE